MLIASYDQTQCGRYTNHILTIEGHANYSDSGTDIVCAAVSILVQTLASILIIAKYADNCVIEEKDGTITSISYKADPTDQSIATSFQFVAEGMELLSERYPDHISIEG